MSISRMFVFIFLKVVCKLVKHVAVTCTLTFIQNKMNSSEIKRKNGKGTFCNRPIKWIVYISVQNANY